MEEYSFPSVNLKYKNSVLIAYANGYHLGMHGGKI
jgi:hypothetical protein